MSDSEEEGRHDGGVKRVVFVLCGFRHVPLGATRVIQMRQTCTAVW